MVTLKLHQNNSGGGSYWISGDKAHAAMLAAGFRQDGSRDRYGCDYTIDIHGTDDVDAAIKVARVLMKRASGYDGTEEGCECCGPPFYFV